MRIRTLALLLFLPVVAGGCTGTPPPADVPAGEAIAIASPAAEGSGEPRFTIGEDGRVYLSWIEALESRGHRLMFSFLDGEQWAPPRQVTSGEEWFVNWADVPNLAVAEDGTIAAQWLVRSGSATYAYDVWLAVSTDGGDSWTDPVRPHTDGVAAEHGFVSLVPDGVTGFDVVWLDGRQMVEDPPGPTTLRHARLSVDGSVGPETVVDDSVCDCCPTAATRMPGGELLVAYRDRTRGEVRDILISRQSGEGWTEPTPVHADGWQIAACPVNGPAVATRGDALAVAWYTESTGSPAVHLAIAEDGVHFAAPIRLDGGDPAGRLGLTADASGWHAVWLERIAEGAAVVTRRVSPKGAPDEIRIAARTIAARSSGYPRIASRDDGVVVAWTVPGAAPRVATGVLPD